MIFRCLFFLVCLATANANELSISSDVKSSLQKFCFDWHDEDVQKGDTRLDNLHKLKLQNRLSLPNKIQEQIHFGEIALKNKKHPSEDQLNVNEGGINVPAKSLLDPDDDGDLDDF